MDWMEGSRLDKLVAGTVDRRGWVVLVGVGSVRKFNNLASRWWLYDLSFLTVYLSAN
jgi:hypothetical protein